MSTTRDTNNTSENKEMVENSQHFKERAERNRQKALLLKKCKIVSHPYKKSENGNSTNGKLIKVQGHCVIDSGGGFLIEDNDDLEEQMLRLTSEPAPIIINFPHCEECKNEFKDSYLLQTFDLAVCDTCRDPTGKHSLITKTEAKQEYLLKDCDFDKREPPLKYVTKKNPHNANWGEMKLYLQVQIEQRALEVWGSEEKLLEEKELRDMKREGTKIKQFNKKVTENLKLKGNKKIKRLRMQVRSSLYDKTSKATHTHEFGEDTYNANDDTYTHACVTCGYEETYEKM